MTAEEQAKAKAEEEEAKAKGKEEEDETSDEELTVEQLKAKVADSQKRIRELNRESADRRKKLEALEKAEGEAEIVRKKAEEAALVKNQEWQQLAEKRAAELEKQKTELEPFKEQAEKYKAALDAQLTKVKEKLPKYLLPLIENMDPVEAMAYITEYAEELGAKPLTYSETPEGREKKVNDEEKKEAQKASGALITRTF